MHTLLKKLRWYGLRTFIVFAFQEVRLVIVNRWFLGSYSQLGEDLVLDQLLGHKKRGFYVDVGAYDPYRFSNTMRFYRRGWRGINIEPNEEHWKRFEEFRPRDTNLNIGIGKGRSLLTFYRMNPSTLSTFSKDAVQDFVHTGYSVESMRSIRVMPLNAVFTAHASKHIDFLSLDVEGYELEVLRSNDWKKYRPRYLCIETAVENGRDSQSTQRRLLIGNYLTAQRYTKVFDNGLNTIYKDDHHE